MEMRRAKGRAKSELYRLSHPHQNRYRAVLAGVKGKDGLVFNYVAGSDSEAVRTALGMAADRGMVVSRVYLGMRVVFPNKGVGP